MKHWRSRLTPILGALLLLAAHPGAVAEPAATDLLGHRCDLLPREGGPREANLPPPLTLSCGNGQDDGHVAALAKPLASPEDPAARHALWERTLAVSTIGEELTARLSCRAGTWWRSPDDVEILLRPCSLNEGGWPHLVMLAALGDKLIEGDGLPIMLPVIEAGMQLLAPYQPAAGTVAFGGTEAARETLAGLFPGPSAMIGHDSYRRYADLLRNARLEDSRRHYRAAEDAYRQALIIVEQSFGKEAPGVGTTLMSLALEVSNQGRFSESAALLHRADPIIVRSPNHADQARLFTYSAFDAANAGKFTDALGLAREAAAVWRDLADSDDPSLESLTRGGNAKAAIRGELAHALTLEAAMATRVGELAAAEGTANEALAILGAEQRLPPWWKADVLVTLGEIYAQSQRLEKADEAFRGALILQQRLFGDTLPTATTLLLLGKVYAAQLLDSDSLRAFRFALDILAKSDAGHAALTINRIAPLLSVARRMAESHPEQQADLDGLMFRAVQMASRGTADDTIAKAAIRLAAADPAIASRVKALQDAERQRDAARLTLATQTALPDSERSADRESALLASIAQANGDVETLTRQLQQEFPFYARLSEQTPIDLARVQSQLAGDEALVLFAVGREDGFVLLVRRERFHIEPLKLTGAALERSVKDLRRALQPRPDGRLDAFDLAEAHGLYQTLFGGIKADLAGVRNLVILPDGALSSLPFGLLVVSKTDAADYHAADWLARRFAVTVTPSIQAFSSLRARPPTGPAGRRFLGIGNPAFVGAARGAKENGLLALAGACRDDGAVPPPLLRALAPLPDSAVELRAVARSLGAGPDSLLLGAHASETELRSRDLSRIDILYFATHGLLPGELQCQTEPGLALSPPPQAGTSRAEDGLLEASEIASLTLHADLVVLSACNTAQAGQQMGGAALSGLAEAFFHAGARTVIASHWPVPSAATAQLMTGMVTRLGPQLAGGIAESLRQSQLALIARKETAHPFYWAAFSVIGEGAAPAATERSAAQ